MDTRDKRASGCGFILSFLQQPMLPDGTLSAADRLHVSYGYRGIAAAAGGVTYLRYPHPIQTLPPIT